MLKKFYLLLDFFLPKDLADQVEIDILFRARSIVAATILGILIGFVLFTGTSFLGAALIVRIAILCSILALCSLVIFLKTRTTHFEHAINWVAFIKVASLFTAIYLGAFSPKGMGFFSLIWLVPSILMMAYYFRPRYSIILFTFNMVTFGILYELFNENFFFPIQFIPTFKSLYVLYLTLVLISCYLQSYLYVQLSEHLKEEFGKQKSLLLESAKFQSLGQMASNLAHDINNPLFTIQGKLHQIRNLFSHDELDLEKCDQIIEEVESTILKLSQIVKGISTFARQADGDQMVSVSADELIRGLVLLGSDRIAQSGITFDLKIAPGTRVICYPSYISQVLINLLNNAIDALENSKIKLIQVEALEIGKWIEIHIRDSGPGIDPLIESKIFDAFFTTKKYGKGTGLGLSISKGLVENHGGNLKYQRLGNMTSFIVRLPTYE